MFKSFFPNPRLFFSPAVAWTILMMAIWYSAGPAIGRSLGFAIADVEQPTIVGLGYFATASSIWFYLYFWATIAIFSVAWQLIARNHPWVFWSTWVSGFILFSIYFSVDVDVALNAWRGPFYDMIVKALTKPNTISQGELYLGVLQFFQIASIAITFAVITLFVTSHYLFRWRTAMNNFYVAHWPKVRHIEGASQRVQEDTMRFATTVEGLGQSLIETIMTLIAFMPLLLSLSKNVVELPVIGHVPHPLLLAAIFWSVFGTVIMVVFGAKLPGLQFHNQRVEAAYRKELVYGEDSAERAGPATLSELFANVRTNYFRMYFHYTYFNIVRNFYLQTNVIFPTFILVPTISAAAITFGVYQQIVSAFSRVTSSFQFLVSVWPTIIELLSIYKRLRAFEAQIDDRPLPPIEHEPVNA